jgi:hypothetical protein
MNREVEERESIILLVHIFVEKLMKKMNDLVVSFLFFQKWMKEMKDSYEKGVS